MTQSAMESWETGDAYEQYMGRWSKMAAVDFLRWLAPPRRATWADIGCGMGALTICIVDAFDPVAVVGIDRSDAFVAAARRTVRHPQATFQTGDATALPLEIDAFDLAVSGLVLNFVPQPIEMVNEMARVTKVGGTVATYLWDYAAGMQLIRTFWDAVIAVNPQDAKLDEATRFPICQPDLMSALFRDVGLSQVETRAIEIPTVFRNFEDYWSPFLGGQGPAPTYLSSLDTVTQQRIRAAVQERLPTSPDGSIRLTARAWAVRGIV